MKKRKIILSIVLALILASTATACKGNNGEKSVSDTVETNDIVSTSDKPSSESSSLNDTAKDSTDTKNDKNSTTKLESGKKDESSKSDNSSAVSSSEATSSKDNVSKTTSSKTTSSKTTSSKESSSSSGSSQNIMMNFVGPYACQRAGMDVRAKGKNGAEFTVTWASSASSYAKWVFSGTFDNDTMTVEYKNCQKTVVEVNEYGLTVDEDKEYDDGTGRIVFNTDDNTLTWEDDEENIADGMIFRFNGEPEPVIDSEEEKPRSWADISRSKAIAQVKQMAGSGAEIVSAYEGYTTDGLEAWVVSVMPITNDYSDDLVTYYVSLSFCYSDRVDRINSSSQDDDDNLYANITENSAIAEVRKQVGSGAEIVSSYEGYSPEGYEAWVVTVLPISKDDDSSTITYYVSSTFCYSD